MIKAFLIQLGLYTTLYSNQHIWTEDEYKKGLIFTPLIGLIIGGILYLISLLLPEFLEGFILLFAYTILTGGLHMDGYSDTLDGILARRGRDRALEIMQDPLLGTFGILGLIILSLGYYSFFPSLGKALTVLPLLGRYGALLSVYKNKYARLDGMGRYFVEGVKGQLLLIWLPITAFLVYFLLGLAGLLGLGLTLGYSYYMGRFFLSRLGGMTGDTVGFIIESSQLIFALTFLLVDIWI